MSCWGISKDAPEIEEIKSEFADYINGLNCTCQIPYTTYSELFDFTLPLIQAAYELGKKESEAKHE